MSVKHDQLLFRCFDCKKNYKKDFNRELIKRFANVYEFCNRNINKFILLLRKGVYPFEYMDGWEWSDEALLPMNEDFNSTVNMENMTCVDYRLAKRGFKHFNNNNAGDYHDLYVRSVHYYLQMYMRILEINPLKYIGLILPIFCLYLD